MRWPCVDEAREREEGHNDVGADRSRSREQGTAAAGGMDLAVASDDEDQYHFSLVADMDRRGGEGPVRRG